MTLLDYSDADISAQAHSCFTRFIATGNSSSSEPKVAGVASKQPVANEQPAKATPLVHHVESEYADVLMAAPSPLPIVAKELCNSTVLRVSAPRRVKMRSVANTSSASPRTLAGSAQALKMV